MRSIDTTVQIADCDRTLRIFEDKLLAKEQNKTDLLVTKYYVKSLLRHDEFQLGVESKTGFKQWQCANKLD